MTQTNVTVDCTACKGTKGAMSKEFCKQANGEYGYNEHETWRKCHCCEGRGTFPALDKSGVDAILNAILSSKGPRKGKLKSSRPKYARTIEASRAYYVWRLARFHGGVDCTMPMCAEMDVRGDGERERLDYMSRLVAQANFGTARAGASRWMHALTGEADPFDPLTLLMQGTTAAKVDATFVREHFETVKVG